VWEQQIILKNISNPTSLRGEVNAFGGREEYLAVDPNLPPVRAEEAGH
jgi:hypothetical protein